jgi:Uma2 family endonuclease
MLLTEYLEHYTVSDYVQWPGDWELIQGRAVAMTPSPGLTHQLVSGNLFRHLHEQMDNCPICMVLHETDWEIAHDTVVRPDIMVVCNQTDERVTSRPELVAEVVSQSTAHRDERVKFYLYAQEGVPWYVLVYPQYRKAKIYGLQNGRYSLIADLSQDAWPFAIQDCSGEIDFSRLWID